MPHDITYEYVSFSSELSAVSSYYFFYGCFYLGNYAGANNDAIKSAILCCLAVRVSLTAPLDLSFDLNGISFMCAIVAIFVHFLKLSHHGIQV